MPLTMDVFSSDAFNTVELTDALDKVPHKPGLLGSLGIFEPRPVRTTTVAVENRNGVLTLVPTTPRGAAPTRRDAEKRNVRDFRTTRIALADRLHADEIQSIRAFGQTSELTQVQEEVMRRLIGVRNDIELTLEHMRLGAIQGIVLDSDGSELIDWFDEWGIDQPSEIDFDLDNANPASGAVRKKCNQVIRAMVKAAQGAWIEGSTQVYSLCGDNFWDDLTAHSEVRQTYLNTMAAQELRNDVGSAYGMFRYGEITWINYRGTDDGSTVAVGSDKAHFFPVGGRQVFQHAMSPGESLEWVNTLGQPFYARLIPDLERNEWVEADVRAYPLMMCTRPEMLQRAKRT